MSPPATPYLYAIVIGCATLIVFLEMASTFQLDVVRAFTFRWSWILVLINAGVAAFVYFLVRLISTPGLATTLFVGVAYPVIIRSRFTIYRQFGGKDDQALRELSLKLDHAYRALQDACYQRLDPALGLKKAEDATTLADRHTEEELGNAAKRIINSQKIKDNQKKYQDRIDKLPSISNEEDRKYELATILVELGCTDVKRVIPK